MLITKPAPCIDDVNLLLITCTPIYMYKPSIRSIMPPTELYIFMLEGVGGCIGNVHSTVMLFDILLHALLKKGC